MKSRNDNSHADCSTGRLVSLIGCATKRYPQAANVTGGKSSAMNSKALKIENAKTQGMQQEIESTGEFDGRTVLGFLGDFGIGNVMAKRDARKMVLARP